MMIAGLAGMCGLAQAAFVTIGNAGNAADPANGGIYGDVAYTYRISATEVTIAEFQLATGAGDGDENYWNDGSRNVGPNAPVSVVSLYEARKYCNWLTTGDVNSGYYGNGGNNMSGLSHDAYATANGLTYFLPTEDEWYKAAYYTGNSGDLWSLYANGIDTAPGIETDSNYGGVGGTYPGTWVVGTGTTEQNGTYDMMGNLYEWMETSSGVLRGSSYYNSEYNLRSSIRLSYNPALEDTDVGIRVVAIGVIPEPASAMLVFFGAGVGLVIHRVRRSALRR